MSKVTRFSLLAAIFAIFVGTIAYAVPKNSGASADSWFHRAFVRARRPKSPHPQTQAAASSPRDAQAVSLAQQAISALVGSTTITDAMVQGTASFVAGSDQETGSATLEGHTGYESRIVLSLSAGQRSEVRNFSSAPPQGKRSGPDGVWHTVPLHNCWSDPTWFFPALTLQSALNDSQVSFAYIGQDTKAGVAVQHIQISRVVSGQASKVTSLIQQLSQVDIYLDATKNLPVAIDFIMHPDDDLGVNLPVEIQYSGWQANAGGIQTPAQIRRFLQNSLTLSLTAITISLNTGLPQSDFTI